MKVLRSYANPVHKPRPHSRINMPRWRKCPLSWQTTSCVRSRNLEHLRLYYIGSTWIIWNILKTFLNRLLFPWPKIIFKLNSRAKFHHVHYTKGQIKFFQCGKNMQNSTERTKQVQDQTGDPRSERQHCYQLHHCDTLTVSLVCSFGENLKRSM